MINLATNNCYKKIDSKSKMNHAYVDIKTQV